MHNPKDELDQIRARLIRLQRVVMSFGLALLCMAMLALTSNDGADKKVESSEFSLIDKNKRNRGTWTVIDDGGDGTPMLTLCDANGVSRVAIGIASGMPLITINEPPQEDGSLTERIVLSIAGGGQPHMDFYDRDGKQRVHVAVEPVGPGIVIRSADGATEFRSSR